MCPLKREISTLVAVYAFAMACLADDKPVTIVTRDHQVYENAVIVDRGDVSVSISYDSGVVRVALANLPADLQKQLGYISKIPDAPNEMKSIRPASRVAATPPRQQPPQAHPETLPKLAAVTPVPAVVPVMQEKPAPAPTPVVTVKVFTQAQANALYGLKESAILKKWGKPVTIERFTDLGQKKVKVLVYDPDESMGTKFWIYEKDGSVSGGCCQGKLIRSSAQQAKLDIARAAGN